MKRGLLLFALLALSPQIWPPAWLLAAINPAPSFTIKCGAAVEGQGVPCTITKSGRAASYSKVSFETFNNTAVQGRDYVYQKVILTFGNTELAKTVYVATLDNNVVDGARTFAAHIMAVRFASIASAWDRGTINDNDVAVPPPPPPPPPPAPPPPPSGTPPTYRDIVTAVQPCVGSYIPDTLIVGQQYKVVGLSISSSAYRANNFSGAGLPPTGVVLNPVIDDGIHRGDGWPGLWVPFACVSKP